MYQTLGDEPPTFLVSISAVLLSAVFFVADTWSVIRRDKHRPHVSCSWQIFENVVVVVEEPVILLTDGYPVVPLVEMF